MKGLLVVLAFVLTLFAEGSREGDSLALVEMISKDSRNITFLWGRGKDSISIDQWRGVTVEDDRVVELDFTRPEGYHYTRLWSLPESIVSLSELRQITASDNNIGYWPEGINKLQKLTHLIIQDNGKEYYPDDVDTWLVDIGKLTSLEHIDLSRSRLCNIPIQWGNLSNLKRLNLNKTEISTFTEQFGNLKQLTFLEISGFSQYGYDSLDLKLPESFGNLQNLDTLIIHRKKINNLPNQFGNLSSLKLLDLSYTQLTSLPESFGELQSLETFIVNNTQLQSLPESFGSLQKLQRLNVKSTNLHSVPFSFANLKALKTLIATNSDLTHVPYGICHLTNIDSLFLDSCNILSIHPDIPSLKGAEYFNVKKNLLTGLPTSILSFSVEKNFNITGNYLDQSNLTSDEINWLDNASPGWNSQNNDSIFQYILNTQYENKDSLVLYMLREYNPHSLLGWHDSLQVSSWPGAHADPILNRISKLTISGSSIDHIPELIKYMDKLAELDISNNNLTTLPRELGKNRFLKTLNLANNKLVLLPKEITNLTPRTELDVSGNNLQEFYLDEEVIVWLDKYDPDWRDTQNDPSSIETVATVQRKPLSAQFTGGSIQFSTAVPVETKVSLFDFSGREIFSGAVQGRSVAVPPLARGIYLMQVKADAFTKTMKLNIN